MSNTPQTKKGLGTFDFFCVGFGAIVGVGWAVSLNKWMASAGGPIPAALGYLITLVLMVPVGLCFAELVPMLPVAGGTTAFTYRAFGEKASYVAGWLTLGAFLTLMPWEAIYVVDIASILFPALKAGAPLYVLAGSDIYLGHIVVGTIIALFFFYINYKGADLAAGLQKVLCIFLIGVGVLSMVCGLVKFDVNNLMPVYENIGTSAHNSMFGGMFAILATSPFFLCGFENIPQAVEDAGGSHKKVGFTVLLSIIMACLFYALLLFCIGAAWHVHPALRRRPVRPADHLEQLLHGHCQPDDGPGPDAHAALCALQALGQDRHPRERADRLPGGLHRRPLPGSGADRPADDLQRRGLRRLLGSGCLLPD